MVKSPPKLMVEAPWRVKLEVPGVMTPLTICPDLQHARIRNAARAAADE